MPDELDERIRRALHADVAQLPFLVTERMVEDRLRRTIAIPWLAVVATTAVVAAILVAVTVGPMRGLWGSGPEPSPTPTARPVQVWPDEPLPPPYDWAGVRDALGPRGIELEIPTAAERATATMSADEIRTALERHLEEDPGGGRLVSIYLAAVTNTSERLERPLERELMFVAETTGHATGNCFDLRTATGADIPVFGACFYTSRSAPPSPAETTFALPAGIFVTDLPLGRQCVAITLEEAGATTFPVQWWDAGASDDCTTRTSDIVSASGRLVNGRTIAFTVWLIPSGTATIEFEVEAVDGGISAVGRDDAGNEQEIHFSLVPEVLPSFVPVQ